jgi:hypothetical protein
MPTTTSAYFSYLLRLWLAGDDDRSEWRIALIDPQTGERRGFISLEALTAFLQTRMEAATSSQAMNFIATPPNANL